MTAGAVADQGEPGTDQVIDLGHHGDHDLGKDLVNFAVNLHDVRPPEWLTEAIIAGSHLWASYPDASPAREALARLRGVDPTMVLPTSGAAEAFTLIAQGLGCRRPTVIHPQFTEPEAALVRQGYRVDRVILDAADGFRFRPGLVDEQADLVVIGNPTNPTGVLHPADQIRQLLRPGRVVVVDEAFADETGEVESLIGPDMPGLVVTRSLTKIFSIAGIRSGYVVGDPALVARLAAHQTPWSVSWPAIHVMEVTCTPRAQAFVAGVAEGLPARRRDLIARLVAVGLAPVASQSSFVLVDTAAIDPHRSLRAALVERGIAVRRGESFPGLGPTWIRLAVRSAAEHALLAEALASLVDERHRV